MTLKKSEIHWLNREIRRLTKDVEESTGFSNLLRDYMKTMLTSVESGLKTYGKDVAMLRVQKYLLESYLTGVHAGRVSELRRNVQELEKSMQEKTGGEQQR
jgi:cob(I)alamin adenosyltransferase